MRATRWIGGLALLLGMLGGAVGLAADKPPQPGTRVAAKVNINQATRAELTRLDGVGAGTADRIIAYRDAHGPFKRVQDLLRVPGVGRAVLERNAHRLTVK